jgi:serine/threonine protein kinase
MRGKRGLEPALPPAAGLPGAEAPASEREADPFRLGAIIADKFRIERVLGRGAMGIVLAARHLVLDEMVAIKCIRPGLQSVPDTFSRFAREAKTSARLHSDHIARVLDVGVAVPIGPYMVMEYLEGRDLSLVLSQQGPLPVASAAEYGLQICEALALAHAVSITHLDLKPQNLFLTRRGDLELIKVLDFGIAAGPLGRALLGGTPGALESSCIMGTPRYMSPEQISASPELDSRSDLWSLGAVIFELLSGRPAFLGDHVTELCAEVLRGEAPNLWHERPSVPKDLACVIQRCLEKEPARRFQNVGELAWALLPFAPPRARLHAERAVAVLAHRPPVAIAHEPGAGPPSSSRLGTSRRGRRRSAERC